MILLYLSSGLFLGWSLGANDASNIFGTAVGTKMVRFRIAAVIASIFVILGAVLSGSGTSQTLSKLGAVNQLGGSFMVALAAGLTVLWMTRSKIPVSTSQAIVGAIIGWNWFAGKATNYQTLTKIALSWVLSVILAALFAFLLYQIARKILCSINIGLFRLDVYTRFGLILVGAFGAYSLGANNIANVVGVFIPAAPLNDIQIANMITISGIRQLFFIGGLAISMGIFTYSFKVMQTVGTGIVPLSPNTALLVVLAEALVLFLFASPGLHHWLVAHQLPAFPLVPVSSSQLVIGGVIGIGLSQGGKNIKYNILGRIALGWMTTPAAAAVLTYIALFFLQNTFGMQVYAAAM